MSNFQHHNQPPGPLTPGEFVDYWETKRQLALDSLVYATRMKVHYQTTSSHAETDNPTFEHDPFADPPNLDYYHKEAS